jgi:hypothetical protein
VSENKIATITVNESVSRVSSRKGFIANCVQRSRRNNGNSRISQRNRGDPCWIIKLWCGKSGGVRPHHLITVHKAPSSQKSLSHESMNNVHLMTSSQYLFVTLLLRLRV